MSDKLDIRVAVLGMTEDRERNCEWPSSWPPPRQGEQVFVGPYAYWVRDVVWHPGGRSPGNDPRNPFIQVVLSNDRPTREIL